MTKRRRYLKASRNEHLAVLRGEVEHHKAQGSECCAAALQKAIDVLERMAAPSGCAYEADPPHLKKPDADTDFLKGMLDGS